jgi:hypothetical protein
MKVKVKEPEKIFTPIVMEITIESKDELLVFYKAVGRTSPPYFQKLYLELHSIVQEYCDES